MSEASGAAKPTLRLPERMAHFYGGGWHASKSGRVKAVISPADGAVIGEAPDGSAEDVDAAVAAAKAGFEVWSRIPPLERAAMLRNVANIIRAHGPELALLDAVDGGNPVSELKKDVGAAAFLFDYFAGLVTEMKGDTIPMGPDSVNFSVREPFGVVARLVAFNHPFMFTAGKAAAPLAAGNSVIMKPPEQAPLSSLLFAELIAGALPPGVFNVVTGGAEVGAALSANKGVAMIGLIGSVPTGRAVMRAASDSIKPVIFELGGKNALIAYADADPVAVAHAMVDGMNFTWCGQSCGSTSRAFLHADIHDRVLAALAEKIKAYRPGLPTDPATTMGAIVSKAQYEKVLSFIAAGKEAGARVVCGGGPPDDARLSKGFFIEPTVFAGVTQSMRIASEEIFGPVLSVLSWSDETQMLADVNSVEYGLTCAIWTNDLLRAHRVAKEVQAGFVWINEVSKHFFGAPFGGYKQSGIGREECLEELIAFTQEKHIHINLKPRV